MMRWWDGAAWTDDTAPGAPPGGTPIAVTHPQQPPAFGTARGRPSIWLQNRTTVTVLGIVAVYLVLAATTRIVLFGILPLTMSISAVRRREPLGLVAVAAAGVAIVVAFLALAH